MKLPLPNEFKTTALPIKKGIAIFPNISRIIPEAVMAWKSWEYAKVFFVTFLCGFLLMAIIVQGFEVKTNQELLNSVKAQRTAMLQQEIYWRTVTAHYPLYRDGYLKLASIAYRLGKKTRAKHYLDQALAIDPNFPLKNTFQALVE